MKRSLFYIGLISKLRNILMIVLFWMVLGVRNSIQVRSSTNSSRFFFGLVGGLNTVGQFRKLIH